MMMAFFQGALNAKTGYRDEETDSLTFNVQVIIDAKNRCKEKKRLMIVPLKRKLLSSS
jgi:uncharacterized protein YfaP (DUF2135 family)